MNLFNLNNEQILKILTGQESNPNTNLIYTLLAIMIVLCILFLIILPSKRQIIDKQYGELTEKAHMTLKKQQFLGRNVAIIVFVLFFLTIGLIVNNLVFINKHKNMNNTWITEQIQQIAEKNPLLFSYAKSDTTKRNINISDFTYNDNKLKATIKLQTTEDYENAQVLDIVQFENAIWSPINGSINITADINTHTMEIEPNDVTTAIMFKVQEALIDNNIQINPDTVSFSNEKNQIKALVRDSNEIVTINYNDDINDMVINIKSTGSVPITIDVE